MQSASIQYILVRRLLLAAEASGESERELRVCVLRHVLRRREEEEVSPKRDQLLQTCSNDAYVHRITTRLREALGEKG